MEFLKLKLVEVVEVGEVMSLTLTTRLAIILTHGVLLLHITRCHSQSEGQN